MWTVLTNMVTQDAGAHYSVFEEDNTIKTVFIQTTHMKRLLRSYPDVLFIDTTYCLNTFSYPVVVFMVVDGDNVGQCVGYACVKDERMVTLSVLFGEFVRRNEGVCVRTVIVDKDASEIAAVKMTMPECDIVLCRFHVAKSLYDAVRKYCPKVEQECMHQLCSKMLKCASENVFWECLDKIPNGVFKAYLNKNWVPVRHNWANFSTKTMVTWGNKTNNFVERHNRALKTVGNSKTSLANFLKSLLSFHSQNELRLKQKVQELALRTVVLRPEVTRAAAVLSEAQKVFTPYACDQIMLQYNKLKDVECSYDCEAKVLLVRKSDGEVMEYFVGEGCQCLHFVEKGLPCWHMLAVYESEGVNVVETVPERYKLKRMIECVMHETTSEIETGACAAIGTVSMVDRNSEMAEWQKRLRMKDVCRELVSVGSRCGQDMFERRLNVLRGLIERWRDGEEVEVEDCLEYADEMTTIVGPHHEGHGEVAGQSVSVREEATGVDQVSEEGNRIGLNLDGNKRVDQGEVDSVREELVELVERGEELISLVDSVGGVEVKSTTLDEVNGNAHTLVREELVSLVERGSKMVRIVDYGNGGEGGCSGVSHGNEERGGSAVSHGGDGEGGSSSEYHDNVENGTDGLCQDSVCMRELKAYGESFSVRTQNGERICTSAKFSRSKTKGRPKGEGMTFGQKRKRGSNKVASNCTKKRKNDQLCALCLEEEIRKEFCKGGVYMDWIDCDICHKWFHCHCLGLKKSTTKYICFSCKPALEV